ncbi:hypothetical protein CRYUN_Cryun30bG0098100 [Craigia yunnanensis]
MSLPFSFRFLYVFHISISMCIFTLIMHCSVKMARLKQAKEEAEKDVALYHYNTETEYQNKISETSGNSGNTVKQLEEETEMKIKALTESTSRVSKEIVDMLMKHITSVRT